MFLYTVLLLLHLLLSLFCLYTVHLRANCIWWFVHRVCVCVCLRRSDVVYTQNWFHFCNVSGGRKKELKNVIALMGLT